MAHCRLSSSAAGVARAGGGPRGIRNLPGNKSCVALETATLRQLMVADRRGAAAWYDTALGLARGEDWTAARRVFQATTEIYPNLCRAWVSWAQMEKKAGAALDEETGLVHPDFGACRVILQRGLERNPNSSCLCQAWGLMELQKGNPFAAVKLLDRSAQYDPKCKPVQRWKLYQDARKTVSNRRGGEAADRSP